ncbi:MAG: pilin [bacterium]|nr:pilin [bacterium]
MKSLPKILTIFFITVFILQIICIFFLLTAPVASQAAGPIKFTPEVGIGADFPANVPQTISGDSIGNYIIVIYKYAIGIVGILAAIILMVAGVIWLTAGGNASQITDAKAWITASLTGLVIALCSYIILATVNTDLVNFGSLDVANVGNIKVDTSIGLKELDEEMDKEGVSPREKKATKEAIYTSKTGCCFYKKSKKCTSDVLKTDCADKQIMNFYLGLCKYVIGCPEFCTRNNAGTSCVVTAKPSKKAVCIKKKCELCEKEKTGESCVFTSICCEGLCCDDSAGIPFRKCIKGIPTRGKYCK